jgi:hypothetical protein
MFKKEKVKDGPARERSNGGGSEETAAYEDSWYRSLKALAERRRNHDENRSEGSNGRRTENDEAIGVPED